MEVKNQRILRVVVKKLDGTETEIKNDDQNSKDIDDEKLFDE